MYIVGIKAGGIVKGISSQVFSVCIAYPVVQAFGTIKNAPYLNNITLSTRRHRYFYRGSISYFCSAGSFSLKPSGLRQRGAEI